MPRIRMFKVISIAALVAMPTSILFHPVWAQEVSSLTEQQKQEFNRSRLTLEVMGISAGKEVSQTWRKWKAYQGFRAPISEEQFFRLTGYEEEAQRASRYERTSHRMMLTGGLVAAGGLVLAVVGIADMLGSADEGDPEGTSSGSQKMSIGLAIGGIGSGIFYVGLGRSYQNWSPYSTVEGIADEYNQKLMVEVRKKF